MLRLYSALSRSPRPDCEGSAAKFSVSKVPRNGVDVSLLVLTRLVGRKEVPAQAASPPISRNHNNSQTSRCPPTPTQWPAWPVEAILKLRCILTQGGDDTRRRGMAPVTTNAEKQALDVKLPKRVSQAPLEAN